MYDGTDNSLPGTVTVTIDAVNDAPQARPNDYSIVLNNILNVGGAGVLADDTDADGDVLTATLVASPVNGAVVFHQDGTFEYVPNEDFVGTDSFTYYANDGVTDSQVVTVTIHVTEPKGFVPPTIGPPVTTQPNDPTIILPDLMDPVDSSPPTRGDQSNDSDQGAVGWKTSEANLDFGSLSPIESTYDKIGFLDRQLYDWSLVSGESSEPDNQDSVEQTERLMETSVLWNTLDDFAERIEKDGVTRTLIAGIAFLFAAVGSIAYVIWTLWSGYLVSSMVALMPHWQLMDPLAILEEEHDELEDEDDESLESIADK